MFVTQFGRPEQLLPGWMQGPNYQEASKDISQTAEIACVMPHPVGDASELCPSWGRKAEGPKKCNRQAFLGPRTKYGKLPN